MKKLKLFFALFAMLALGVGNAWGAGSYVKVTTAPADWSGDYLIVYEEGNLAFDGALSADAAKNTISVTITDSKITSTDATDAAKFTIAKSSEGYTIKSASGYYIGQTADGNKVLYSNSTAYNNSISLNDDGSAHVVASGKPVLRYNATSGQERFRYFKSSTYTGQKVIHLYKYVEEQGGGEEPVTPTQLSAPANLTEGAITETSATLSWDAVANASNYSVTIDGKTATANTNSYDATGLTAGTSYTWSVVAKGDGTNYTDSEAAEHTFTTTTEQSGEDDSQVGWVETAISDIASSDKVVVTMTTSNGTTYALTNGNGTSKSPAATVVEVVNGKLSENPADNLVWNIANSDGNLTIYPNGATDTWLYCTNSNSGVRVGTNANKVFTIDASSSGYLKNTATSRYLGVYTTTPDWRCYTSSTTANIANQELKFYKEVLPAGAVIPPTIEGDVEFLTSSIVTITAEDGMEIYYTTDGNNPDAQTSQKYTEPFTLTADALVQAIAYNPTTEKSSTIASQQFYKIQTITCVQAKDIALQVSGNNVLTERSYRIVAYVTEVIGEVSRDQQNFAVADEIGGTSVFQSRYCNVTEPMAVGMKVEMVGKLTKYNTTAQMLNGNITILERPAVTEPVISGVEVFETSTEVTITAEEGMSIYYTLDDSEPTATTGMKYTDPFTLTATKTVKAIAHNGSVASNIVEKTFNLAISKTCSEAAEIAQKVSVNNELTTDAYVVTGYVTQVLSEISDGQQRFWISDTQGGENTLQSYYCNVPELITVDMKVKMLGKLTKYNDASQMKNGDVTILKRPAAIAWSSDSYTATIDATNEFPTLVNADNLPVNYSSTNGDVATITNDGTITLVGAGSTTITASFTEDATYTSATASFILDVLAAGEVVETTGWIETELADITSEDEVVITMTKESTTWALYSGNGASKAPTALVVTVFGGKITSEVPDGYAWNISNDNGTLVIYPNGTTESWLYCTDSNNGVRVGKNDAKEFTIDATSGYLKHTTTNRYVGVYTTTPDWRCYTNTTGNTADQMLKFYKKVLPEGTPDKPVIAGEVYFENTSSVTITATSGMEIFYTTNGEKPSNASNKYESAFTLSDDATVKAIAYDATKQLASEIISMAFYKTQEVSATDAATIASQVSKNNELTERKYKVVAYVTEIVDETLNNGQQRFWVADEKGGTNTLQSYYCNVPEVLTIGMKVQMIGFLTKYNESNQMKNGDVTILEKPEDPNPGEDSEECDGSDDFTTLNPNTTYGDQETESGWTAKNAAVDTIGFIINGKTTAVGTITSPVLNGGIGSIKIRYANTYNEANGVSFSLDIKQNGAIVKTYTITKANDDVVKGTVYTELIENINVAGDFQMVFTNLHPTNNSTSNKDRVSIGRLCWTGYEEEETLVLTEGVNNLTNGATGDVTVNRSFIKDNLYTLSLPFALSATQVKAIFGANTVLYQFAKLAKEGDELVLYFSKPSAIAAGTPYLIKPSWDVNAFNVTGATITTNTNNISFTADKTTVTMKPVLSAATGATTNGHTEYWLAADKYLYNNANTLLSLRALFEITTISGSGMPPRCRVALGENVETGVEDIITTDAPVKVIVNGQLIIIRDGVKYNVQGQKL